MGMFDFFRRSPSQPLQQYGSAPFRQRLEGNDVQTWIEPRPFTTDSFQTYWRGNQLPGTTIHTNAHAWYELYYPQNQNFQPQYNGSNFSSQLGQLDSASLLARWRAVWTSKTAKY